MSEDHNEEGNPVNSEQESQTIEDQEVETKKESKKKKKLSPAQEWEQKHDEVNEKYLRLYSEFDNFRRRTQKEKLELYKTAGEDIMVALLPVLDDFERAEKASSEEQDIKSFKEGIDLIYQKLLNILKQQGLNQMESNVGKSFDVELQEAITKIKAPSDDMKGKIIDEVERGYKLNDKVIRFSKVVVGE